MWNVYIIRMNLDFIFIKERIENIMIYNVKKGFDILIWSCFIIKMYFCLYVFIKVMCILFDWNFFELKFIYLYVNNFIVV